MGFYSVTDAFESCRGSYPAMGKEEFFCPLKGNLFNPLPEGIKSLLDPGYGIGGEIRTDIFIRFSQKEAFALPLFKPEGLFRAPAKPEEPALLCQKRCFTKKPGSALESGQNISSFAHFREMLCDKRLPYIQYATISP